MSLLPKSKALRPRKAVRTWGTLTDLPVSSYGGAVAPLPDGKIYLGPGSSAGTTRTYPYAYDPATDTYTALNSTGMNDSVSYGFCQDADGRILHLAGKDVSGGGVTLTCFAYTPATNSTQSLASVPYGRQFAPAVRVGDLVYLCGGQDTTYTREYVYTYSISGNSWGFDAEMPGPRVYGQVAKYGTCLYYFGGRSSLTGVTVDTIFKIDLSAPTPTWATLSVAIPVSLGGFSLVEHDGKWLLIGGYTSDASNNRTFYPYVFVFDPATESFVTDKYGSLYHSELELPCALALSHCISVSGSVFVFGGILDASNVSSAAFVLKERLIL